MSQIKLNKLIIRSFKGINSFDLLLDGDNAVITAENGIGKTTLYDAFLWLLFGKDSTGRKDFEVVPLDRLNRPIKGIEVTVMAEIEIDGISHVFNRTQKEHIVKEQLRGYTTLYWIDRVPKLLKDYSKYIAELITEDTFKLLTDLHFFNGKMHWTDRRSVLLDIAGEIGTPEGFDDLLAALNGRTIDEYKKILSEQKKLHVQERDEINPRLDEILRGLEHPAINVVGFEAHRIDIQAEIGALNISRQDILSKEKERAKKQGMVNLLTKQRVVREGELSTDTSGIDALLKEKDQIAITIGDARALTSTAESELKIAKDKLTATNDETTLLLVRMYDIRAERKAAEEKKAVGVTCPKCEYVFDPNEGGNEEKKALLIKNIESRSDELIKKIDHNKKLVEALHVTIKQLTDALEITKKDLTEGQDYADKRLAEIDEVIKTRPTPPPEQDEVWKKIVAEIEKMEAEIGPPVSEQLEAIEKERTAKEAELVKLNEELAQADRMVKDRARIQELEAKKKDLAQKIADIEKQLADIDRYKATQSTLITIAVNTKFKAVKFKMFKELLNGGLEDCCEATFEGTPYTDMSSGEKIYCGIDIVNVLSVHYGMRVPLFIDHSESMTMPIEANSQTIGLKAVEGVKELQVEICER